jgi:hypothetical protein
MFKSSTISHGIVEYESRNQGTASEVKDATSQYSQQALVCAPESGVCSKIYSKESGVSSRDYSGDYPRVYSV